MRKILFLMFAISLMSPALGLGQSLGWAVLKQQIRAAYPDVRQLSTDSLAAWLDDGAASAPVLLDVRTEEEYAVSHLRNARRIDPETQDLGALSRLPRDTPIVTYCSVGYRSSGLAQRLGEAGFTHVMNLEGSIFAWANEGRPVYRDGVVVRQVHPYNQAWGLLLKQALRAPIN